MNKETLRMQMLAGVITESEYKAKLEEATQKDSLNEHYVAGGIVGIGAINQIPPREKAVYEDAFEYFLSQKYSLNEVEEDQAITAAEKVEDSVEDKVNIDDLSDEEKNQLRNALSKLGITADSSIEDVADKIENKIESTLSEAEENPNKKFSDALSAVGGGLLASHLVPLIPLIVGHMSGIGFLGGLAVTLGTAGALLGLAKALGDGLEEGKEVEEPSLYEEEEMDEAKKPGTFKERSAMAKKARAGKDIGEKGKNFEKIAKSAAKQYGSEEAGKKVAGAVMYGKLNK